LWSDINLACRQRRVTYESGADLLGDDPGSGESSTAGIERITFERVGVSTMI
jgi:hypothetical protein